MKGFDRRLKLLRANVVIKECGILYCLKKNKDHLQSMIAAQKIEKADKDREPIRNV